MKPHEFTHTGDRVLMVKCLNSDGTGYGGFIWPKSGTVENKHWSRKADCDSGGLFGWPWGMCIGDGKDPNACHPWLVFSARPENVIGEIEHGAKCKAVPGDDGDLPTVVYFGNMAGAMRFTHEGRHAYIVGNSSSAASSGDSSSAASSGDRSSAASSGYSSSAASSGNSSSAASSGNSSSAASSGDSSSAASSGDRSSAASSGYSSSAASSGNSSSAASSGDRSSAASSGDRSVAVITGEYSKIEVGQHAIGGVTACRFHWIARPGAVILCQWVVGEKYFTRTLKAKALKLKDGQEVKIEFGTIVKEFSL